MKFKGFLIEMTRRKDESGQESWVRCHMT